MQPASQLPAGVAFGHFRLLPHRRELLSEDRPIKLGGRAFDVLLALIETPGSVISKEALMARAWPGRVVEENNLQAQVAALRRALGAEHALIRTVAGRGYQFTGEVRPLSASPGPTLGPLVTQTASPLPSTNIPEAAFELIGRDEELGEILNLAADHRLVTLVGAGGIGKTTLALALARELRPHFADGVWLAEFSGLADQGLVPAVLAATASLEVGGGEASAQRVAQALGNRRLLLVLDTCEHVIDAAAALAEAVLGASSALRVIATSREPLRAEGEWVYSVRPLAVPAADAASDDDPLRYGAVRLFIERARAAGVHLAPEHSPLTTVAAICQRLDGIPLAIELAAARVPALGVEDLALRLDDRLGLLSAGRRTALPRHQTLRATHDWSYALLAEAERVILRRLGVFAGPFSLRAASAVAASPEAGPSQVADGLSSLLAKSLVTADAKGLVRRYRLLDTTRAYALEKLTESGEREAIARRHAAYYQEVFERAAAELETRSPAEWLADYGPRIDNLRAALDWAFSPAGEISIGVALAAAAVPLWMLLSLMEECCTRTGRALAAIAAGSGGDTRCEMQLHAALAVSLMYRRGAVPEIGAAATKALEIAQSLDDAEYQLRSLWALWSFHTGNGGHHVALNLAQRFHALAATRSDPSDRLIGDRMVGTSHYYLGDLPGARRHTERVLAHEVAPAQKWQVFRFEVDQWAAARVSLARILWLQGLADQAMRTAESSVAVARAANHAISVGQALALAVCPIALFRGDLDSAEQHVKNLLDHSTAHALARWHAWGLSHQGVLAIKRGEFNAGLQLLRAGFDDPGATGTVPPFFTFLMAEALGRVGQIADGLAAIEEAIGYAERSGEHWATAEMLRIKGELLLLQDAPNAAAAAEDYFRQALDWARRQGALAWELRAATSLARLQRDEGNPADGIAMLQSVYDRFTEGFETADLRAASELLRASSTTA